MNPRTPSGLAPQANAFDRSGQPSQMFALFLRNLRIVPIFLCLFSWCSDLNLVPCFEYNPQAGAFDQSGQPPPIECSLERIEYLSHLLCSCLDAGGSLNSKFSRCNPATCLERHHKRFRIIAYRNCIHFAGFLA